MTIAILSIGDELLNGDIVDGNARTIAALLRDHGLASSRHLTVGDRIDDIAAGLRALSADNAAVIVTGGLGPTCDDVTAAAAAAAAGRDLVLHAEAIAHLRSVREKLGGMLHPQNEKQALLPEGATVIPNPVGTACGFSLEFDLATLFFLPGVPVEMSRMLMETVLPAIERLCPPDRIVRTALLRVFGAAEAEVEHLLRGLTKGDDGVGIAYRVDFPEILLKLRATGTSERDAADRLERVRCDARKRLGELVYGEGEETLPRLVVRLFRENGKTLSLAESCTGGLVAKLITDVAGSSAVLLAGVVSYADSAKAGFLGVDPALIARLGAVSAPVALAMAEGVRSASGSDCAVAVTGIAGPDGGTPEKPVGTVHIALADGSGTASRLFAFHGSRGEIRTVTAFTALDWLRRYLTGRGAFEPDLPGAADETRE